MSIIDIGLGPLSDDELEELATFLENKLYEYLESHSYLALFQDFLVLIGLSQSNDNVLTLTLDFDTAGSLSSKEQIKLHQELAQIAEKILKDELICRKKSN